jgi:A/G-specific adenine glycosylase
VIGHFAAERTAFVVIQQGLIPEFQASLLTWYRSAKRDLPWRRSRDPYAIWVSEIMLQQTRVAAAIPYYERFLARFPDFAALAAAPESDLLSHWAGLGYYYRARNLQKAARLMVETGDFPRGYAAIRSLPGVGEYTAAAVASIGFNLPHAVLDGNVFRVISRVMNDATDISSLTGKRRFAEIAGRLLNPHNPGEHNQAIMELGATVCLPRSPQCLVCPVNGLCAARVAGSQANLPVKRKTVRTLEAHRTVYWIEQQGQVLLWQRKAGSRLMPGFWELPETEQIGHAEAIAKLGSFRHGITFHDYRFDVIHAAAPAGIGPCRWVGLSELAKLPLSTVARKAYSIVVKAGVFHAAAAAR